MIAIPTSAHAPVRNPRAARGARAILAALAGAAVLLATVTAARAHARLERSRPAAGAVLATPPATVELWFNELLDDEFNDVEVFRATSDGAPADATNLATEKPRVSDTDRTHLTAPIATLSSGAYVVQWKVLSRDGHSARGRVLFRIDTVE